MPLLSHLRLFIPPHEGLEVPSEISQKWAARYYAKVPHISGARRKAVGTVKDFQEKIAQPLMKATARWMNPQFISRSGLTYEDILAKQRKKLEEGAARKYLEGLGQAYRTTDGVRAKKILYCIEVGAFAHAWGMRRLWALIGTRPPTAQAAVPLALDWLTGDQTAGDRLHQDDKLLAGAPVLVPEQNQVKRFKNELNRRLIQAGVRILMHFPEDSRYPLQPCLEAENWQTNYLVQLLARRELVGFITGGDSHLDFIVKEIPDPQNPTRLIKQLYLEIQVARV